MVNKFREDHLYIDAVILEGVGKYINAIADAVDLRKLDAENVSVVIAQDPARAAKDEAYRTHAAVGSALGMLSVRYVHEIWAVLILKTTHGRQRGQRTIH